MSFLGKLISSLFNGIHVGDKYEDKSTHDSAPKQNVSGLNSSANMTIGTNISYSYQGQQNTNNVEGVQVVINGPCELSMPTTSPKTCPIPPLSEQAKSIMKQLIESGHDGLVTWKPNHVIIEGLLTTKNKNIVVDEIDSVDDDLACLAQNGYLKYYKECDGGLGSIYYLTSAGKKFGIVSDTKNNCDSGRVRGHASQLEDNIFRCIENNPGIHVNALAEQLSISRECAQRHMHALMGKGQIEFRGNRITGGYYPK